MDVNVNILQPRIKMPGGISNYMNVKSGNYNRQICGQCLSFKGFPQAPGVYNVDINDMPSSLPNYRELENQQLRLAIYQAERMSNHPGSYRSGGYVNYLNTECNKLYPKRYVKGYWPDEQLIFTNTPSNGCRTILNQIA